MNRFKIKKQSIFKFGKQILRLIAFFVGRVVQKRDGLKMTALS